MTTTTELRLTPAITPHGRLVLVAADDAPALDPAVGERLREAFSRGSGPGLLQLGAAEVGTALPPALGYWRELGGRFVTALCNRPDAEAGEVALPPPPPADLGMRALAAPPLPGSEYLTGEVMAGLWTALGEAFGAGLAAARAPLQDYLKQLHPAWNVVGRVHFNLAENRKDPESPFAFLATYTPRLSAHGKVQHLPLGQALREYAGAAQREQLLSLLLPVQRAAESCAWLRRMVDAGELFHPLRWSPVEAFRLLGDVPALERAGVVVRMPAGWKGGRPARPRVTGTVGARAPAGIGLDALLDFRAEITLEGEALTAEDVEALLAGTSGLALVRGQWVEVDRERLERMLARYREAERLAAAGGLTFSEAMRALAGAGIDPDEAAAAADPAWAGVVAGPWLAGVLAELRAPQALAALDPGPELRGTLRPYQLAGVRWLHLLTRLGLGACLADDMGLGKTIQVLALLLVQRRQPGAEARPSLLVAPASLLANWAAELERFAPGLRARIAHPSAVPSRTLKAMKPADVADVDLVITSYGTLLRLPWLADTAWSLVVLDEAQAIKNPDARQTRAVKKLEARARIALTGTPIENRLGDLWSIFDFLDPGLLGSAKAFTGYTKRLAEAPERGYGPLRDLVRPYLLRRLKTDRSVIADLPDKTEVKAYCLLGRKQAALYQETVKELAGKLAEAEGMQRRGLVLATLMRLKQICNHPSQWLGDGAWAEADSGKWARLRELGEVIASRQEKALVFTQFREVTAPLAAFLGEVFGREGLVLHGEVAVRKRQDLVRRFQEDESVPFFVLSLKAGGSGLNLTAAAHVIHFDRWWNPAVENQATDRAFRIGQTRNVLVHKLVCRGTVEEKIDALIESKRQLAADLLEGGAEVNLTELDNEELLRLVSLDLDAAMKE
jgi:non-specific serine/threonine protein kinase